MSEMLGLIASVVAIFGAIIGIIRFTRRNHLRDLRILSWARRLTSRKTGNKDGKIVWMIRKERD